MESAGISSKFPFRTSQGPDAVSAVSPPSQSAQSANPWRRFSHRVQSISGSALAGIVTCPSQWRSVPFRACGLPEKYP